MYIINSYWKLFLCGLNNFHTLKILFLLLCFYLQVFWFCSKNIIVSLRNSFSPAVSNVMDMSKVYTNIPLITVLLVSGAMVAQSHIASEILHQKLEDSLSMNHKVLYQMYEAFFLSQNLPPDWLYLHVCVTVGSEHPRSCESNFKYCQTFQWSSSALVDVISFDQLLIMDNVISECIIHTIDHQIYLSVPLHIDNLPCGITEDDILPVLMQLLSWVCAYKQMCNDSSVHILHRYTNFCY